MVDSRRLLDSLARELRSSLTFIARSAEYYSEKQNIDLDKLEKSAGDSLKLIDNYLLCAQTEYGQQLLPMEPVGPGSVLYETAQNFYPAASQKQKIIIKAEHNEPVMANKRALVAALYSLAKVVMGAAQAESSEVMLVSRKKSHGDLSVGVFTNGFSMKPSEVKRINKLLGKSDMPLSNQSLTSGIDMAIARQLISSMGGELSSAKYKGRGGLSLSLLKSNQLSLVENG